MNKLAGKVAIVTGAAHGIGRGIAEAFALEGADVAIADVATAEKAQPVLDAIRQNGRKALFVRTDVADEQQVRAMVDSVLETFGHVDILVNNAGIFTQSLVEVLPIEDWDRVLNVNLRGTFLCTRYVLPHLLEQGGGRVINIASQLGYLGGREVAHYSASKGGVIAFTKALAREVSTRNVLVNAIAPGPIVTDLLRSETEEWKAAKLAELPIGRFGEVSEVAPTAVFLASDDASYYVGQTLGPNGGDVML
ncbi:SDR family NAD(P)-dependent oxidoreductase [Ktedonobacter robiniae]|uniref:3-oxoacyl-ACP reductase n=1 Tax=Ktedonobacter robiniae TaxID=2778365 RepID=A0ABQ3URW3_9CHLR|nr:3-oxoacyl-ACP reductase family protein [Ktedonobacter robiniae]GHO55107.1 3-oxoacyl-ACP reductase [Ktedonobacter robiniae]